MRVRSRSDGSLIRMVAGRKKNAQVSAESGQVSIKKMKAGFKLSMQESGLDFSTLATGGAFVDIGVGSVVASHGVAAKV